MKEELRRAQDEASRAQRRLLAFTQAAQAVQRARTPAEVYRTVGEEVVRLGFNAVVFSLTPDRASLTVSHTTFDPTLLQAAVKLTGIALQDYRMPLVPGGFYQRIIAEGQTIFTDRNRTAEIVAEGLPGPLGPLASRLASLLRIGQGIAARLTVGGETHGVLLITGTGLTEAEVPAVTAFASQTAVRLENARVEEALRKSEEKYRTLYESSVDGIISTDMKGQILDANQAYLDMLGYSKDELRRLTHQQLTPLKWHECEADIVKNQILARGYSDEYEKEYIRKDGTAFPISIRVWLVKNEQGPPVEMWGIVRDITAHKRAEEELRRSEERYRAFTVATAQVVWITNAGGEVVVDLPSWRELTGQSEEAIKGWRWIEAIHPDDRERVAQVWAKAVEAKGPYESEFRVRKYDGSYRLFFARGIPVLEADGSIREWVGTCTDITERKRAEAELKKHREHLGELVEERTAKLKRTNEALEAEITERKQGAAALRESEAKYHALFQASADGILVADLETRMFSYANPAACRLLGYSEAELTTMGVADIHSKDDLPWVVAEFEAQARGDKTLAAGLPFLRKDGAIVYADVSAVGMSVDGRVCIAGFLRDITERKRAEEALRQSEAYLAESQRLTHTGSWAFDLASNTYVYVSEEDFRIWGFDPQDGLPTGEAVSQRIHPEDRNRWRKNFERALREKVDSFDDYRIVLPDGTVKHIHTIRHPVLNGAGDVIKLVGTSMDITERKRAEEALRRTGAYLSEGQRLTHTGSFAWSAATRQSLYWSEEMFRIFGLNPQEGVPSAETFWQRIHPEDLDRTRELLLGAAAGNMEYEHDHRIVLPDGTIKHIHAIGHPVPDENGKVAEYVGTAVDVTERKLAEEALHESETRFRTFVDHAADALFILDFEQGTVVDVNRSACESLGYTRQELIGMTPMAFDVNLGQPALESFAERTAAGETVIDTHWHRRKDGSLFPVEVHTSQYWYGGRRFLLKLARDISDRLRAEEQRQRLHQLEADLAHINRVSMMGELTASIAHEVNQPLSGVVSNGGACLRWLAGDAPNVEEAREAARRIVRDGKRAGEVIARVRALVKRAATPSEKLDLNEIIREVLALVGDEAKRKSVNIRTQFADDLLPISGDRVQLQQVMLNLVMNAIEAMSSVEERPRELLITTRNIDADQILVTVKDSGPGIDPNTLDKIFDPFYTTKPGGMGMGLSISRSILLAHGGRLWAAAKDGPGTIFHFSLPKYHDEESNAAA